jgi:uncharacterized membrane protein
MTTFPSIPGWDGIHPAMVQFPIVLLFVAPLFLLISLFARQAWRAWAGSALLLMALGSFAVWLAVASGHAAGQLVDKTPALGPAIADHEAFGVLTRTVFTVLTLVLAALMLLPLALRKPLPGPARISLHALFLVVYLGCTLAIANAASRGGRLVHELGVQAMVVPAGQQAAQVAGEQATPGGGGHLAASDQAPPPPSQPATPTSP